ncbi:MAG: HAMP domain-containing protein [Spirochaetales bacterium]|nr:HAMP domain-containing protein [Spirochaetales bacterium]
MRQVIQFKNGTRIFLEPVPAGLSEPELALKLRKWRMNDIRSIAYYDEEPPVLRPALRQFPRMRLDSRKILSNYSTLIQYNRQLKEQLKRGPILLLYSEARQNMVILQMGSLLMQRLPPERVLTYLCGDSKTGAGDFWQYTRWLHRAKETAQPKSEKAATIAEAEPVSQAETLSQAEPVSQAEPEDIDEKFARSKFTIRVKMLSIITGIIVGSLSLMIFLASYFFRQDSSTRVEENGQQVTQILAQQVDREFENVTFKVLLMAAELIRDTRSAETARLFFSNNKNFLYIGVAAAADDRLTIQKELINQETTKEKNLEAGVYGKMHLALEQDFLKARAGIPVVRNASKQAPIPVIGMAFPLNDKVIIAYVEAVYFLPAFRKKDILTTYMVDEEGTVIAHPDTNLVQEARRLSDSPIVKTMLASNKQNLLTRYEENGSTFMAAFEKLNYSGLGIISSVEEDLALAAVYRIQRRNLLIMGIVVCVAVLIILGFSRTITIPIVSLVGATHKVEQGEYNVAIRPTSRDEIGQLTYSFKKMAKGLKEREKMKDALGRFVNKEIAEMVLKGELKLGGERKECAIFFSDLRGFTAMSEGLSPEEVVEILNEYFTAMVKCVNDTHGIVDKFIGDAIMAHWGALKQVGNNTENAVNAALLMRKALIDLNARHAGKGPFLQMGSGINSGPVISGQIGSEDRLEYTVIGDAVNLASRVETLNKPFGTDILISQDAYEQVPGIFKVEQMPAIKVKGKAEPQIIYAVIGRLDDPDCMADLATVRKAMGIQAKEAKAPQEEEVKYEILEK